MSRKVSLAVLCLAAAGIILGCVVHTLRQPESSCKKQLFAMDTYMEFVAFGRNSERAVDAAMDEVKRLDALLSTGSASSEVTALNRAGTLAVSKDTASVLQRAAEIWEKTGGLFDYTVYPLVQLWGFSTGEYHVPSPEELAEVLPLVDASQVAVSGDAGEDGGCTVTLGAHQAVDFGGIAKGYAAARVMEIYREYGIRSGQVSLGGNVQVLNSRPDGRAWRIGIRDPGGDAYDPLAVVSVEDCAVVTSGGYERYFEENGKTYIHILDPRTGYPADSGLASVSIVSPDGTLADALSTSLYIMGLEGASQYWREHREEFEMVLVTEEGGLYITEGLEDTFAAERDWEVIRRAPDPNE